MTVLFAASELAARVFPWAFPRDWGTFMKIRLIALSGLLFVLGAIPSFADPSTQQMDQEFMRMLQQRGEENQREEEFKNPKKPEIGKDRAILGNRKAPIM